MSLFEELKRRKLFRVFIAYVVGAWAFAQVADLVADNFNAPDRLMQLIIALLVVGLPVSLVLAWAFDITSDGIKRSDDIDPAHPTLSKVQTFGLVGSMFAVVGAILYLMWSQTAPPPPTIAESSIAVLPFVNVSSDREQEYFSDGLADTLLHRLSQIKDLRVAARTSSFKFKGLSADVREIARQLGVATVLEGSVHRQGDRVRINAQLVDGSDGSQIWSREFNDTLDDIFRVQDEIANNVAGVLQTRLGASLAGEADLGGTDNIVAYEAYLKGVEYSLRGTPEATNQAVAQLELAAELDPDYARAWVALSWAYSSLVGLSSAGREQTWTLALRAAEKAIALEPNLAEAYRVLANALIYYRGDTESGGAAIEKSAELGPNDASSLAWLGWWRNNQGLLREALRLAERAVLINPLDPYLQMELAERKLNVGLADEAIGLATRVTNSDPGNVELLFPFGLLLRKNQQYVEMARIAHRILEASPGVPVTYFMLSDAHMGVGNVEQADENLRRVEAVAPDRAWDNRARFCLLAGDIKCFLQKTERFRQLEKDSITLANEFHEGRQRLYEGNYQRAIELLQPDIGQTDRVILFTFEESKLELYLAAAYDKLGDTRNRDALLEKVEQEIRESLANGLWVHFARHEQLKVAALRGNAQLASEHLAAAIDADLVPLSGELEHYVLYDSVREHPDFQAQLKRAKAREAEMREQFAAESL